MAIQETIIVDIAEVIVNDDYRVELMQLRKVVDYSPQQARDLANELIHAADAADASIAEDMHERLVRMNAATPRAASGEVIL